MQFGEVRAGDITPDLKSGPFCRSPAPIVPGPPIAPCLGVRNVPFSMVRLRRANRMTVITVSRQSGRPMTQGNLFPYLSCLSHHIRTCLPFYLEVEPSVVEWQPVVPSGPPYGAALLSCLSQASLMSLASNQPTAACGRRVPRRGRSESPFPSAACRTGSLRSLRASG